MSEKVKLLWASPFSLLDTSSGAALAIREILYQLAKNKIEIKILSATIFDNERGLSRIAAHWPQTKNSVHKIVNYADRNQIHHTFVTTNIKRELMTAYEEAFWHAAYTQILDSFQPDIVITFGGINLEFLIASEAKHRSIPIIAYVGNENFVGKRWCRDISLMITDSEATARLYKEREDYDLSPVGAFISPEPIVCTNPGEKNKILCINPTFEKGGLVIASLALFLEKIRPDITFEIVESRGSWADVLSHFFLTRHERSRELSNVVVTGNQVDMRPIYGRSKLILCFTLCWESFSRSLLEAMMNGIPAIISNSGGMPEVSSGSAIIIDFPPELRTRPYKSLPSEKLIEAIAERLIKIYDNNEYHTLLANKALEVVATKHNIEDNTRGLLGLLHQLIKDKT